MKAMLCAGDRAGDVQRFSFLYFVALIALPVGRFRQPKCLIDAEATLVAPVSPHQGGP